MEDSLQTNEIMLFMIIGVLIMIALALAFIVFHSQSQKKILTERMRTSNLEVKYQEELLHSNLITQENERKRIAKDLHDDIGSKLNVINLYMHQIKKNLENGKKVSDTLEDMDTVIAKTISSTRTIAHELLPPTLEGFGLIEALGELSEEYSKVNGIDILFNVHQDDGRIHDPIVELNLFRVVQELANNSIRHGKASQIDIDFWLTHHLIKVDYKDNGEGFDPESKDVTRGLGLRNLRSRVKMIGGTVKISSKVGDGARFVVQLNRNHDKN